MIIVLPAPGISDDLHVAGPPPAAGMRIIVFISLVLMPMPSPATLSLNSLGVIISGPFQSSSVSQRLASSNIPLAMEKWEAG